MLGDIFYWLLNMSITASLTGGLVMAVRLVKKLPRRLSVYLWAVPFARMAFPVGLNSPYSLMGLLSEFAAKTVVVHRSGNGMVFSMMNCVMAADSYFPIAYGKVLLSRLFDAAGVIWIAVAAGILLLLAVCYFAALREVRTAVHLRDNIYCSDKVAGPVVYGVFRPKILLPASRGDTRMETVILHEQAHIRSGDNLWRLLALGIAAVHWFNPLAWLFLKCFLEDLELACDERVLARLDDSRRREYALSLLETGERSALFAASFGGAKIRARIENILSFRKLTWLSLTAGISLIAAISWVLLTNGG